MDNPQTKTYPVQKITAGDIKITGDGTSSGWKHATLLTDFSYPWEDDTPLRTSFKALHDNHSVYFLFDVEDPHVHVEQVTGDKMEVIDCSRVEIFFRKDERLSPYYCLEIDATGRVLDYCGYFHRQFDFTWSWQANSILTSSKRHEKGYIVEVAISKQSLTSLGLLDDSLVLQAGLFRADNTHTVRPREHMRWISWLRPDAATPDFHIPSAFGRLQLVDQ
jgi:hypothetical protein